MYDVLMFVTQGIAILCVSLYEDGKTIDIS
jgi:hypothetical protein